jgi:hypothetical protein
VTTRIPCAAVAAGAGGSIFVTAAGAFLIELDSVNLRLSGYYGFGGSAIEPTGTGGFYIAGRTESLLFPTFDAEQPERSHVEEETGWLIRLDRVPTPDAAFEEDDPRITYQGEWGIEQWKGHSGQKARRASTAGATATIEFEGTGIRLRGRRDPGGGIVRISLDQNPQRQNMPFDVHAPQPEARAPLVSLTGLAAGPHTLTVEVTGTSSERASGTWFWLDGFDVF